MTAAIALYYIFNTAFIATMGLAAIAAASS
jgi:hypothetical protein